MPEGVEYTDLKAIMLDTEPLSVMNLLPDSYQDDLFYGDTPRLRYAQGAVAENKAHVTLQFGIHPMGGGYHRYVDAALGNWTPADIQIDHVGFFPASAEGYDYSVIVAHIVPSDSLLEARRRLSVLPFTDQFADEYKPHLTLCYIKGNADRDAWIGTLDQKFRGKSLEPLDLNYGDHTIKPFA